MPQYEISNIVLDIDSDNAFMLEPLNKFLINRKRIPDIKLVLKHNQSIKVPQGEIIFNQNRITWLRKPVPENGYYVFAGGYMHIFSLADLDSNWTNGVIDYCLNPDQNGGKEEYIINNPQIFTHLIIGIIFRYSLLHHEGIVIHASTIDWNGKGIIFSAPSGTGKSTHVKLWQEFFGDQVIVLNDDTPAVRFKDGKPYVFGTPWSGTSNIHCNQAAPLSAIFLLEQAPQNSLQQLKPIEAIQGLMPRVFFPYYDAEMMNTALIIFEKIVSSVPVFLLKCRPDKEAVELVYQWMK